MALVVHITVTDQERLLTVSARRKSPVLHEVNTYIVAAHGGSMGVPQAVLGEIEHNYNDGAIPLAQAMLEMVADHLKQAGTAQ